jgi:2-keto-4-pentenoate hydratase/2-oxohepta-3-ene-1,7-dioic acid hydratase in catechol pathway
VPRNEVGDGSGLTITLDVNGKRRQEGNTSMMLHPVAALVASVSRFLTLEVGDLLFTGTPSGVGPVVPGDVLEARIEKIGTLRVEVAASD